MHSKIIIILKSALFSSLVAACVLPQEEEADVHCFEWRTFDSSCEIRSCSEDGKSYVEVKGGGKYPCSNNCSDLIIGLSKTCPQN